MEDQEESSCTVYAGYLHKEGSYSSYIAITFSYVAITKILLF